MRARAQSFRKVLKWVLNRILGKYRISRKGVQYQGLWLREELTELEQSSYSQIFENVMQDLPKSISRTDTYLRNYYICKFALLTSGEGELFEVFFAGVSYGVNAQVLTRYLTLHKKFLSVHLIDPMDGRGRKNLNYNTDKTKVLEKIQGPVKVNFVEEPLSNKIINQIGKKFDLAVLNTTDFQSEFGTLEALVGNLKSGGYIILELFGHYSHEQQCEFLREICRLNLECMELPTLQLIIWRVKDC